MATLLSRGDAAASFGVYVRMTVYTSVGGGVVKGLAQTFTVIVMRAMLGSLHLSSKEEKKGEWTAARVAFEANCVHLLCLGWPNTYAPRCYFVLAYS